MSRINNHRTDRRSLDKLKLSSLFILLLEPLLEIFDLLGPVSSSYLSLPCKKFYPLHKQFYRVVPRNPFGNEIPW